MKGDDSCHYSIILFYILVQSCCCNIKRNPTAAVTSFDQCMLWKLTSNDEGQSLINHMTNLIRMFYCFMRTILGTRDNNDENLTPLLSFYFNPGYIKIKRRGVTLVQCSHTIAFMLIYFPDLQSRSMGQIFNLNYPETGDF